MAPGASGANSRIAGRIRFLLTQFQIRLDAFRIRTPKPSRRRRFDTYFPLIVAIFEINFYAV